MLEGKNLGFRYTATTPWIFYGLDISVGQGEIVGLPGPSGCGKSTLGRILTGYLPPDSGQVRVDGNSLPRESACPVQLLYQHPELAMNPRWKARQILTEGFTPTPELMDALGVRKAWLDRYPHELSGGELSRIALCRALGPSTRYLVADEATAMLDSLTQAQIWNALRKQATRQNIGVLVISHDEFLLHRLCSRMVDVFEARQAAIA